MEWIFLEEAINHKLSKNMLISILVGPEGKDYDELVNKTEKSAAACLQNIICQQRGN